MSRYAVVKLPTPTTGTRAKVDLRDRVHDLGPADIERRYRAALACARRTLHVDPWAQRLAPPPGSRLEDHAVGAL